MNDGKREIVCEVCVRVFLHACHWQIPSGLLDGLYQIGFPFKHMLQLIWISL